MIFTLYESFSCIDDELLARSEGRGAIHWRRWGSLAACFCLILAAIFLAPKGRPTQSPALHFGDGGSINHSFLLPSEDKDKRKVVAPDIDQSLTLQEARALNPFGEYLPAESPVGYITESIRRYRDENSDYLSLLWTKTGTFDELRWQVSPYQESMANRVTAVEDRANYDLGLYPIPLADSVPEQLMEIVDHPIFRAEELTLDAVKRRAYTVEEGEDSNGARMSFGVLYGDVLVEVTSKGISPEWLYEQLAALVNSK